MFFTIRILGVGSLQCYTSLMNAKSQHVALMSINNAENLKPMSATAHPGATFDVTYDYLMVDIGDNLPSAISLFR